MPDLFRAPHGPSFMRNIQVPQRLRQIFAGGIDKSAHVPLRKVVVPSAFLCDHDTRIVSWILYADRFVKGQSLTRSLYAQMPAERKGLELKLLWGVAVGTAVTAVLVAVLRNLKAVFDNVR